MNFIEKKSIDSSGVTFVERNVFPKKSKCEIDRIFE